jgi:polyhydroxyalkanoate synthase
VAARVSEAEEVDRATPHPLNRPRLEDEFDRKLHAAIAAATSGASPWAAMQAWEDWAYHLSLSPARMVSLGIEAWSAFARVSAFGVAPSRSRWREAPFKAAPGDHRFENALWREAPYDALAQAQLAGERVWDRATEALAGVRAHHMRRVWFMGRQLLHALAPSNFAWTNPVVADAAARTGGRCFADSWSNLADDVSRLATGQRFFGVEDYKVGRNLAVSAGKVVLRNDLMELIQYAPSTADVRREPILIVPAWIMKYYILDLSPENSLVRYLVNSGFTVFCISWKNPSEADRGLGLDDYRVRGVDAALDAIGAIVPGEQVHGVGYCLGGTILAIAAAALDRDRNKRLATLTLLAAQTDFTEAGDLMMFIDESQIAVLEDLMNAQGFLDARQMAGAFYALRTNDMLWLRIVERYLAGVRRRANDLDAWFSDATRMPARMHSQYLRWLFLENRLAQGNLDIDGKAVALKDLRTPIFAVGAERDHIAPWRSVHKIALFSGAETTFVLSGGGHNTAIVSPPGKPRAYFRINLVGACDEFVDPDEWLPAAKKQEGSWWPAWTAWLGRHSASQRIAPPSMGAPEKGYPPIQPAPGGYVHEP